MTDSAKPKQIGDEADRNAILALLDRWRLPTKTKNIHAILELVTDDVVFLPSSAPPIKGKEAVEELYKAFFPTEIKQEAVIEEVRVAGETGRSCGVSMSCV